MAADLRTVFDHSRQAASGSWWLEWIRVDVEYLYCHASCAIFRVLGVISIICLAASSVSATPCGVAVALP